MSDSERFKPRPLLKLVDQIADAFEWPRSRPVRVSSGSKAQVISSLRLCCSESALTNAAQEVGNDVALISAVPPPSGGAGGHSGRRVYDPFLGASEDISTWRRAERVVLDAAILVSGGKGGVEELLATDIKLKEIDILRSVDADYVKFVGYVPDNYLDDVLTEVFAAGAGRIGEYDLCCWRTEGTGSFRASDNANPTIGSRGVLQSVPESRFESIVKTHDITRVVSAYKKAHPYEEPAFDVLDMRIPANVGFGRIGVLAASDTDIFARIREIDSSAVSYGEVKNIGEKSRIAIHAGALHDVFKQAVECSNELSLIVVCDANQDEIELLVSYGVSVIVLDRSCLVEAYADVIAGSLSRGLGLVVEAVTALRFPSDLFDGSDLEVATASEGVSEGTWRLHFDGGSRGNPGLAAYGWVLYAPDGSEASSDGVVIGEATNNYAEWTGLLRGLEHAAELGITSLEVRGDSELVVKQATGVYKVKNESLKPLSKEVAAILRKFDDVDIAHVYRSDNARADELANIAMDSVQR